MKNVLALIVLALAAVFAAPVYAQSQAPSPTVPAAVSIAYGGCPAPSVLAANLAPQFSSVSATLTDSFDVALLAAAQTAINGKIGEYFAAKPQLLVTVRVQQVAATSATGLGRWQWIFTVSQATEPSGSTCPTS